MTTKTKGGKLGAYVRIGVVPTLLSDSAWDGTRLTMQPDAAKHSWAEIERAFKQFSVSSDRPDIILIPEVSVPGFRLPALRRLAGGMGSLVIAGMDFTRAPAGAKNQAVLLIPSRWPEPRPSHSARVVHIGKTYPAVEEQAHYKSLTPPVNFAPDPVLWLFDGDHLGRFGICLCFDFMDVDRPPLYRGQIHHLFVLSHNRDVGSFAHIAESLCRTIFCNVVVCNTGWYGGSIAITPYSDHWRRPVYQILGNELSSAQIVKVPVASLDAAIRFGNLTQGAWPLKALPPGFVCKPEST